MLRKLVDISLGKKKSSVSMATSAHLRFLKEQQKYVSSYKTVGGRTLRGNHSKDSLKLSVEPAAAN